MSLIVLKTRVTSASITIQDSKCMNEISINFMLHGKIELKKQLLSDADVLDLIIFRDTFAA